MPADYLNNGADFSNAVTEWIVASQLTTNAIEAAEAWGKHLAQKKLSTSQIRNVFGEVRRIEAKGFTNAQQTSFLLLKPKMAYTAGRFSKDEGGHAVAFLKKILDEAHPKVIAEVGKEQARFDRFVQMMEAVLAYHKAEGGK